MPEGPEIRRAADRVQQQIGEREIDAAWFAFPELAEQAASLVGARVTRVDTWGKAMLIRFSDRRVLYSHNQLYGVWKQHDADQPPDTKRTLRVRLTAQGRSASLYSASDISLWHEDNLAQHPFLSRLGPDLLSQEVTAGDVQQRLNLKQFHKRSLGALLLDQGLVAGLGNYLRSEILFFAQLSPKTRPIDLSPGQQQMLAKCIIETTLQTYQTAGITNCDAWIKQAKVAGEPRSQWRFAVFDRAGLQCHRCGEVIQRIMVGSRRLYLCPRCQPS
ncbi:endonuclease VIII [Halomonas sp. FME1]|uniref:DNA-(apurinic or apyrimidinic site) lyase n=1 Tax=Halomonas casei TaxID=2742613 RepID=A0ABR9F1U9_9GAMM|nr:MULTISPECIES: endonuclease VIII [Halomonas]MBE0400440.1 endonuclease VIII [Halomonas casei]PCC22607.1 endonuclease VIII [Halomonas sp. JB37]